ncbi:hypothetical protein [Thiobacter aerophilum]|uniref:PPM-type phosphatase domain-containing protein n=1 Tax=Thiobacter aerophilum TaxID=3121275 RepID=A0ABV0EFY2_9BURK
MIYSDALSAASHVHGSALGEAVRAEAIARAKIQQPLHRLEQLTQGLAGRTLEEDIRLAVVRLP